MSIVTDDDLDQNHLDNQETVGVLTKCAPEFVVAFSPASEESDEESVIDGMDLDQVEEMLNPEEDDYVMGPEDMAEMDLTVSWI